MLKADGGMIVWWGTPVEARSAFARLIREKRLTRRGQVRATAKKPCW